MKMLLNRAAIPVRWMIWGLAFLSMASVAAMMTLTMADVIARLMHRTIYGVYDIVGLLGAVAIIGAVPLTKAVKGHVAIEYFYHRAHRRGRRVMDVLARVMMMVFFGVMSWQSWAYGCRFLASGEGTSTLYLPIFWVPWLLSGACILMVFITFYHLINPGKSMIRIR